MKKLILFILLALALNISFAQNKEAAEKLVDEGIAYHDKGDYDGAILRYDKALALDKDNLMALNEKAYSLMSLEKYDEAIECCKRAIAAHPREDLLKMVYVNYGTAYDFMKKTDKSIEIYEEGIKVFPNYYLLYFNKGVTLVSVKKNKEAIECFQKALVANPSHAGSHNALARLSHDDHKVIPAVLAYSRFLTIEPQGERAKGNLKNLKSVMGSNVTKTGEKSITINMSPEMLSDKKDKKKVEDDFRSTEMMLSLSSALDLDDKNKNKPEVELFKGKFEGICESLKNGKEDGKGFYWDYYVPYFIELKEKNFLETFSYIVFASSEDDAVMKWLGEHKEDTKKFFEWSDSFDWVKG